MQRTFSIIAALFLSLSLQANERMFNKLKVLQDTEPNECLIRSKKLIKRRPDRAEPYYFACQIYMDKVEATEDAHGKFFRVRSAIRYAEEFEARADDELRDLVSWRQEVKSLETMVDNVFLLLEKNDLTAQADALSKKWLKLAGIYEGVDAPLEIVLVSNSDNSFSNETAESIETNESIVVNDKVVEKETVVFNELYGMPTGSENIFSFNYNYEMDLLDIINRERANKGLALLEWNDDLARACRYHAYDQASQDYFDHNSMDRKDGKLVKVGQTFERIRKFYDESLVNAENLAAGGTTPEEAYQDWFTSKGHYDTMFNPESTKVGLGVARVPGSTYEYYWVLCTAL